ncbi:MULTISPECIES: DUF2255 family protein [unclassified Leifsonia]|uniref:DUF2255 family protein n=1 Tax=unclassified Leifsonia TaxID=2663824 RepID=UPI0006FB93AA|nr:MULTISPECIES: DUF2255 family protein [unclassified Leifsonia]KQX05364.1 hypothetical protein ASC59_14550 [Leifsonia sp. Root1293]KRA08996.1 hypothetical protein ASD61_14545 [Leifsonia sp. Root60]
MTSWTNDDLARIGGADELELASLRADGTLRPYVTIWVVRVGDELVVRSAHGSTNPWFRRANASGIGRIRAAGLERDVTFSTPTGAAPAEVDAAYHSKYDRYGPRIVGAVVGADAADVALSLQPRTT